MKFISKSDDPMELVAWKQVDKMFQKGRPNWNRVPGNIKRIIKDHLKKEQGYICCYCEQSLSDEDNHIEHLKPKGENYFPQHQIDYDNLLCSCQFEIEKGEPRHCGNSKGSWYDDILLVSPLDSKCEEKFKYTFDGYIEAVDESDISAITTINKLRLDLDKLNDLRRKTIEPFLDEELTVEEVKTFVSAYLVPKV